jgi:hypothetical protein
MANVKQQINFDFEEELERVLRRAEKLKAAIKGSASIQRVDVKAHNVRAHSVRAHTRLLIKLPKAGR